MKDWLPMTARNRVALGIAMLTMGIFKNELELRRDLEIKKIMGGDDMTPYEAGTLVPKRPHLADLNNVKQPKACVGALDMEL